MLAIVNPLSSAVLFVTTAANFSQGIHRRMADQSALAIAVILAVCVWVGPPSASCSRTFPSFL